MSILPTIVAINANIINSSTMQAAPIPDSASNASLTTRVDAGRNRAFDEHRQPSIFRRWARTLIGRISCLKAERSSHQNENLPMIGGSRVLGIPRVIWSTIDGYLTLPEFASLACVDRLGYHEVDIRRKASLVSWFNPLIHATCKYLMYTEQFESVVKQLRAIQPRSIQTLSEFDTSAHDLRQRYLYVYAKLPLWVLQELEKICQPHLNPSSIIDLKNFFFAAATLRIIKTIPFVDGGSKEEILNLAQMGYAQEAISELHHLQQNSTWNDRCINKIIRRLSVHRQRKDLQTADNLIAMINNPRIRKNLLPEVIAGWARIDMEKAKKMIFDQGKIHPYDGLLLLAGVYAKQREIGCAIRLIEELVPKIALTYKYIQDKAQRKALFHILMICCSDPMNTPKQMTWIINRLQMLNVDPKLISKYLGRLSAEWLEMGKVDEAAHMLEYFPKTPLYRFDSIQEEIICGYVDAKRFPEAKEFARRSYDLIDPDRRYHYLQYVNIMEKFVSGQWAEAEREMESLNIKLRRRVQGSVIQGYIECGASDRALLHMENMRELGIMSTEEKKSMIELFVQSDRMAEAKQLANTIRDPVEVITLFIEMGEYDEAEERINILEEPSATWCKVYLARNLLENNHVSRAFGLLETIHLDEAKLPLIKSLTKLGYIDKADQLIDTIAIEIFKEKAQAFVIQILTEDQQLAAAKERVHKLREGLISQKT